MNRSTTGTDRPSRRAFVRNGSLFLFAAGVGASSASSLFAEDRERDDRRIKARIGLVTDLHYADKPAAGSRYYRQTPDKLAEAAARFAQDEPHAVVELGDLIDAADSVEEELGYLKRIDGDFSAICKNRHYVLGNHCVYTLTKDEFLEGVGQGRSYYSFDVGGFHFVVLDACFRGDGEPYGRKNFQWTDANIPKDQIRWLRADLKKAAGPTVVFVHQRLDVGNHYGVKNAPAVRKVLEESGKVLVVLQGHNHVNDHKEIGGIHYCTLAAMVEGSGEENNGYSTMDVFDDATIRLTGFRRQESYEWT